MKKKKKILKALKASVAPEIQVNNFCVSLYSSEVVWPERTQRKSNSREMSLSTQALRRLTPCPSPVNMALGAEYTAQADKPEEVKPIIKDLVSMLINDLHYVNMIKTKQF